MSARQSLIGKVLGIVIVFAIVIVIAVLAMLAASGKSHAGDPTGYWAHESAAGRAPPKAWWDQLASHKGLCCSFADGERVEDVDWDTQRDAKGDVHYRVMLLGAWHDVPDDAVVDDPNRYGPAVVWPVYGFEDDKRVVNFIRCFLPGAGA